MSSEPHLTDADLKRQAVVIPVDARQRPAEVQKAFQGSLDPVDVLCLSVGLEPDAFSSTPEALAWVKGFRASASPAHFPGLIVLALISPTIAADEERKARFALVYECGAVVVARGDGPGELRDWKRVQSVIPTLPAAFPATGTAFPTTTTIGLPPATAAGYGRQPAHVDGYDPVQFEKAINRLNQAEWWELNY